MADNLKEVADAIRFRGVTESQVREMVQKVYGMGWSRGAASQRKVTNRIKWRYGVLLKWMHTQLSLFSIYTRRREYKEIVNGLLDIKDEFLYENNLNSSYSPVKYEVDVLGEPFEIDLDKEMTYLLQDIVGRFIAEEDEKQSLQENKNN